MTSSLLDVPAAGVVPLLGQRKPRIRALPAAVDTSGHEAADLLRETGQIPDGWQCDALCDLLAEGPDRRWAARRTYVIVPRQNGKGGIIEPVELYGMFMLHETILHSAHQFDTAREAFMRIKGLIEGTPDLLKRVKSIMEAHGKEGIYLRERPAKFAGDGTLLDPGGEGGQLRFHARTKGGGRGKSPQRLILDEGFALTREQMAALLPSISAQDDPHVNVFSTPPPVGQPCEVLMRARKKMLGGREAGRPAEVVWLEWGVERGTDVTQPHAWAQANPAYNIRISERTCRDELDALGREEFGVERCGMWPAMDGEQWLVIGQGDWDAAADADPPPRGRARPAIAVEMSPDRAWVAIWVAWWRPDGLRQVELIDYRPGTGWLPDRLSELKRHRPCAWLVARESPASSEVTWMERSRYEVERLAAPDLVAAAGMVFDGIAGELPDRDGVPSPRTLRHCGQEPVDAAMASALKRPPEDRAWSFDPTRPGAYLLRGMSAAVWGLAKFGRKRTPPATAPRPQPPAEAALSYAGSRLGI